MVVETFYKFGYTCLNNESTFNLAFLPNHLNVKNTLNIDQIWQTCTFKKAMAKLTILFMAKT